MSSVDQRRRAGDETRACVYKLLPRDEWTRARAEGVFRGSEVDRRDGFIHLSTADQLMGTARAFFKGRENIVLLAVPACRLNAKQLRYEGAVGADRPGRFPHLYASLPVDRVSDVWECPLMPDEHIRLPEVFVAEGRIESPPSPLSSGCPTPPSVEDEDELEPVAKPKATKKTKKPEPVEVFEDPPVIPAPVAARSGPNEAPLPAQHTPRGASLIETLIVTSVLLQAYVYLLIEMSGERRGLGVVGMGMSLWLALGMLRLVKCPNRLVLKCQVAGAALSFFLVPYFFGLSLMFFAAISCLGLFSPLVRVFVDLSLMAVQRYHNNND